MISSFLKLAPKAVIFLLIVQNVNLNAFGQDALSVLPYESSIVWRGKKVTGSHYGQIFLKEGTIVLQDNTPQSGELIVDMNTIRVQDLTNRKMNAKLLTHLKSEDFFHVEEHPYASFAFSESKEQEIVGSMTIKGITNEIKIPFESEYQNDTLTATTSFTFDRTKWDIRYGSGNFFSNLGDSMIDDEVAVEITLKAVKQNQSSSKEF